MERISIGETEYDANPEYAHAIRSAFGVAQRTGDGSYLKLILNEGLASGNVLRVKATPQNEDR